MLCSVSFTVWDFIFGSMTHFVLIFLKGIRSMSRFTLFIFACWCPGVPVPTIERLSLLHHIDFAPLFQITWLYLLGSGFTGYFIMLHWFVNFCHYHSVLITDALQQALKSGSASLPTLFFPFNIELTIMGLLLFHINFRTSWCSQSSLLKFCLEFCWMCLLPRWSWEDLTSWKFAMLQFMNMDISPLISFIFDIFHQSFIVFSI